VISLAESNGHDDLGAFALGLLEPAEQHAFERHLAECPRCSAELSGLEEAAGLLELAVPTFELPAALERQTFVAVERAAGATARPVRRRRALAGRVAVAGLAAAVAAAALALAARDSSPPGQLELRAALRAPSGQIRASVDVRKTGIGRVITFRSDTLPLLPKGDYYELWFVGLGDRPGRRNRISAGTFHPDANGRSHVELTAAVDPSRYPVLSVTAEPGDGDPRPTGTEVLRSRP
jgi:anti-sigma-K factor RskA